MLVLLSAAGCERGGARGRVLELELFKQARSEAVFLNESLVLHFSEELERASVTPLSVRLLDPERRPVSGRWSVEGDQLQFRPELPRSPSLSDGGFLPGTRYTLELSGYPLPDALRARSGAPLARSFTTWFQAIEVPEQGEERVFEGRGPRATLGLRMERVLYEPGEGIEILSDTPLHPSTLRAEEFQLWSFEGVEEEPTRIGLAVELARNEDEGALVVLRPRDEEGRPRLLEPGEYRLWMEYANMRLQDLSGRPVRALTGTAMLPLDVRPAEQGPRYAEDFLDPSRRSPEPMGSVEGTAWWGTHGAVRIRLPKSAGDGRHGPVELVGDEARPALAATRLRVGPDQSAQLVPRSGLVVLAAQGSLSVEGELTRSIEEGPSARLAGESLVEWSARVAEAGLEWAAPSMRAHVEQAASLAAFLERAKEEGHAWTVLVAGGDLLVSGRIQVDGPLLLAAGGWIRVTGEVQAREIWTASEGGGRFQPHPYPSELGFEEPSENPLRERLRWGVLSAPVRPPRGVERWRRPQVAGHRGGGGYTVRFLGEREGAQGERERVGPVDDPRLLEGCDSLQLWIELWMDPGGPWDPPSVDRVELTWVEGSAR